jgi:hypothetical protein
MLTEGDTPSQNQFTCCPPDQNLAPVVGAFKAPSPAIAIAPKVEEARDICDEQGQDRYGNHDEERRIRNGQTIDVCIDGCTTATMHVPHCYRENGNKSCRQHRRNGDVFHKRAATFHMASNVEPERRGFAPAQNEDALSQSSILTLPRRFPRSFVKASKRRASWTQHHCIHSCNRRRTPWLTEDATARDRSNRLLAAACEYVISDIYYFA